MARTRTMARKRKERPAATDMETVPGDQMRVPDRIRLVPVRSKRKCARLGRRGIDVERA